MDKSINVLSMQYDLKKKKTKVVYTGGKVSYLSKRPTEIVQKMCLANGTTLKGQEDACRFHMGWSQKLPIYIGSLRQEMIFTDSSYHKNVECIWFVEDRILSVIPLTKNSVQILFDDGSRYDYPVDKRTMDKQMERCVVYRNFLNEQSYES